MTIFTRGVHGMKSIMLRKMLLIMKCKSENQELLCPISDYEEYKDVIDCLEDDSDEAKWLERRDRAANTQWNEPSWNSFPKSLS